MNRTPALVALSFIAAAAAAQAEDYPWNPPSGGATRAEVREALHQATRDGTLPDRSDAYDGTGRMPAQAGGRTRAEVMAELDEARRSGALPERGDAYGSFPTREAMSTRTRAEVAAELANARASGTLLSQGSR